MILASMQLLQKTPRPTLEQIREGLSGNLCRCTGYLQIFAAVAKAAEQGMPEQKAAE
jgi:carbon-monoxide dehydrogenase small subunit